MEDEDEIKQSVDSIQQDTEQPTISPLEAEESKVAEQCEEESQSTAKTMEDNVEESKLEDAKVDDDSSDVKMEELVTKDEEVVEERVNEGKNAEEVESKDVKVDEEVEEKVGVEDDGVKMGELEVREEGLGEEEAEIRKDAEGVSEVVVEERGGGEGVEMKEENVVGEEKGGEEVEKVGEEGGGMDVDKVEDVVGEECGGEGVAMEEDVGGEGVAKEEVGGVEEVAKEEQGGVKEVAKEEQGGVEEVAKVEQGGVEEIAKEEQGGVEEVAKEEHGGVEEVAKVEQGGVEEVAKEEQGGVEEVANVEQGGVEEIAKEEKGGVEEVAKEEQGGIEKAAEEEGGAEEAAKEEEHGVGEAAKEEERGVEEAAMDEEGRGEAAAKEEESRGEEAPKEEEGRSEEAAKEEKDGGKEVSKEDEDAVKIKRLASEDALKVEGVMSEETAKVEEVVKEEVGGKEDEKEEGVGVDAGAEEEETMEDSEATGDEEENVGRGVDETSPTVGEDEEVMREEETPNADTEMEIESEVAKSSSAGKRRRGRNSKPNTPVKSPARKTVGEDVCFICLDGGNLVLCDRRGCPKAYHPSCVDHDDEFFKTKGRWNCGWHLCNQCGKNAYFLCYTCTFSLCKGCSKDAAIYCVRGSKGFCESCMKTVMMIESNEQNEMGNAAFDDNSSWEYLFKDYWIEQKSKLGITSDELAQAKNPWKNSDTSEKRKSPLELHEGDNAAGTDSDNSLANIDATDSKRKRAKRKQKPVDSGSDNSLDKEAGTVKRKSKRRLKSKAKETYSDSEHSSGNEGTGNKKGKRVRRLSKSRSKGGGSSNAGGAISSEGNIEWASQELLEFVMHMKSGDRSVLTQFDVQGLLLEYIKRNKLRDPRRQSQIICDSMLQKLFGKARVGHFEMLKLLESHFLLKEDSHADDNQGSVVDTDVSLDDHTDSLLDSGKSRGRKSRKRADDRGQSNLEDYAAIDRHNINLIYLRRSLMESLMDDSEMFRDKVVGSFVRIRISASNQKQDIYRLVQIIGTSKAPEPYKVGKRTTEVMLEILNLDKTETVSIDTISNQEFTEDECKRLRQSIKCGLITRLTVGDVLEKAKELQEVRVTDWLEAEILRLSHLRDRASDLGKKKELRECVEKLQLLKTPEERQRRLNETPEVHADPKMDPSCVSDEENEMLDKRPAKAMRPRESGFFRRGRDQFSSRKGGSVSNETWSGNARPPNKNSELGRNLSNRGFSTRREDTTVASQTSDHTWNNGIEKGTPRSSSWDRPRTNPDTQVSVEHSRMKLDSSVVAAAEPTQPLSTPVRQSDAKVNETEKTWHYRDPTGKVQGPFSMAQLRKWSNTGYFPVELRIWRTSQTEDDSILLTEALAGRFQESRSVGLNSDVGSKIRSTPSSVDASKLSGGRYEPSNLPSPTPGRSPAALSGKQPSTNQFRGSERLPSPTPTSPSSGPSNVDRSNFPHQSKGNVVGTKQENVASVGTVSPAPVQFVSSPSMVNPQQMSSQSGLHVANQPFVSPDTAMNQTNVGPNSSGSGQGFSNMVQPVTGQNPPVYNHNWGAGYVARPEMVNANLTPNNQNVMQPAQVSYSQWTNAVGSQVSPYAAGYPTGQANVAANFPAMSMNTAWRPAQANMPWGGQQQQQQQPVSQNAGWSGPPAGAMAQLASPSPAAQAMASGPAAVGWTGAGPPNPAPGNTNMVWVGAPGSTGAWGGDQNRNGGGGQWNRQSSGSGGQRVCKYYLENGHCRKGSSCDYMHT